MTIVCHKGVAICSWQGLGRGMAIVTGGLYFHTVEPHLTLVLQKAFGSGTN